MNERSGDEDGWKGGGQSADDQQQQLSLSAGTIKRNCVQPVHTPPTLSTQGLPTARTLRLRSAVLHQRMTDRTAPRKLDEADDDDESDPKAQRFANATALPNLNTTKNHENFESNLNCININICSNLHQSVAPKPTKCQWLFLLFP